MKKYILERSNEMKKKIMEASSRELGNFKTEIFWDKNWFVRVTIRKDDVIEYNVIEEDGKIDFEVR